MGKLQKNFEGLEFLSLGISIVVAILIGVGLGIVMKNYFQIPWLLWVGVFWGVAAAVLNVKKAYDKLNKELDKIAKDPRYKNYLPKDDDDDEDN